MFQSQSPAKICFTFAILGSILGNAVVGLPTTPASDGKDDDIVKIEQTFYSVQCEAGTWGVASRCQAWCSSAGRLNVNKTRCPLGSHAHDDVYFDCYCVGECVPCKAKAEAKAKADAEAEGKDEAKGQAE